MDCIPETTIFEIDMFRKSLHSFFEESIMYHSKSLKYKEIIFFLRRRAWIS